MTAPQLDLVLSSPIIGLQVRLPRQCGNCGSDIAVVGPQRGPHRAGLTCASCGGHCGWLPAAVFQFVVAVVERDGRPGTPIEIRAPEDATVEERNGAHFVVAAGEIIFGPFKSNSAPWRWLDRQAGEPISRSEHVAEWLFQKSVDEQ